MSFDEIFDLTAGVYFNFYNIYLFPFFSFCFSLSHLFSRICSLALPPNSNSDPGSHSGRFSSLPNNTTAVYYNIISTWYTITQ